MPLYDCMYMIPKEEYNNLKNFERSQYNDSIGRDVNGGQVNHIELGEGSRVVIKPTDIIASAKNIPSEKYSIPNEAFRNWPKTPPYKTHDGMPNKEDIDSEKNDREANPNENNVVEENINEDNNIFDETNNTLGEKIKENKSSHETELKTIHSMEKPVSQNNKMRDQAVNHNNKMDGNSSDDNPSVINKNELPKTTNQTLKIDEIHKDKNTHQEEDKSNSVVPAVITGDYPSPFQRTTGNKNLEEVRNIQKKDQPIKFVSQKEEAVTNAEDIFRRRQTLPDDDISLDALDDEEDKFRRHQSLPDDDFNMVELSKNQNTKLNELRQSRLKNMLYDSDGRPNIYRKNKMQNTKKLAKPLKKKKDHQIGKDDIMVANTPRSVKVSFTKEKEEIKDILRKPIKDKIQKKKQHNALKQIKGKNIPAEKKLIDSMINAKLAQLNGVKLHRRIKKEKTETAAEKVAKVIQQKTTRKRRQESLSSQDTGYIPPKIASIKKKQRK